MADRIHWRRLRRRAGFRLMQAAAWVSLFGGFGLVRRCGRGFGILHYRFDRSRHRLERHLAHAMDDPVRARQWLRQAYRVNDGAALEIIAMYCRPIPADTLRAHSKVSGLEPLRAACAEGRGVVLLGMHMGNGMLMTARLAAEGLPVTVVYRESHKMPARFFERIGANHGTEGVLVDEPASAYRQMRRALDHGRVLFVLMDQATRDRGVAVSFLGKSQTMPAGPAELVRRTGAAVFAVLPVAAEPVWEFQISQRLETAAQAADTLTIGFARLMEDHIRAYPHLWSWHHRRWRRLPFEAPATAVEH
jgi:phosphatidylinositol dimannoside acyltransferase